MYQNQRKFVKCFNCNNKPATIKCLDCNKNEPTKICYHCDSTLHLESDHQKQIIPYDQMVSIENRINQNRTNEIRTSSKTPEKYYQENNIQSNSILKSRIKKNEENISFMNNEEILNKNQLKSVELKFRLKFQEQDNTINQLKQHIENIESKHKENLSKMRDQLIKTQDESFQKQEETNNEIITIKKQYEDKITQYIQQIESESQSNYYLQSTLDELKNNHQIEQQESKQIINQLRAEIEKRKFQEQQLRIEVDNQLIQIKKESQLEIEKSIKIIKNDCAQQVEEQIHILTSQQDQIISLQQQIEQLQNNLNKIEEVWQQKLLFEQQSYDELKFKYYKQGEECDNLIKEIRNLQSEIIIYQKENELFQKEKLSLTKQLNQQFDKNEKMDRFIYGSKRSQIKIQL